MARGFNKDFPVGLYVNGYFIQLRQRNFRDADTGKNKPSYYLMVMVPGSLGAVEIKIDGSEFDRLALLNDTEEIQPGASVSARCAVSAYRDKTYYRLEEGAEVTVIDDDVDVKPSGPSSAVDALEKRLKAGGAA